MIYLIYKTCCKSYLVSVWTVSLCGTRYYLSLWKFSRKCIFHRYRRVCRTCHTHSLIYITTAWKRITDSTAKTSSCTTERLYLCRMVVCLIFKEDKPLFSFSVYFNRNYYRAGIYLIWLLHIIEFSVSFEFTHTHKCNIHKRNIFVRSVLEKFFSCSFIHLIRCFDRCIVITILKLNILKFCLECCMTAVVWPICIKYTNLRNGRLSVFLIFKVILNMQEIFKCHCKIKRLV